MRLSAYLLTALLLVTACSTKINESVHVGDGQVREGDINTVNGSIIIGNNSKVLGDCRAVNGRIEVGQNSQTADLTSVNGRIAIGKSSTVKGDITVINGSIECAAGVNVAKDVSTVNGDIDLLDVHVMRDLETVNGDITLGGKTVIERNIKIKGKGKKAEKRRVDIYINDSSRVVGDIDVTGNNVDVKVHLSDSGEIGGDVINAEIIHEGEVL